MKRTSLLFSLALLFPIFAHGASEWHFDLGDDMGVAGRTAVGPTALYSAERGFGFETDNVPAASTGPVSAAQAFIFSSDLPEGNYNVTVTFGGPTAANTTVRSELRRLHLENVRTAPGQSVTRTFTVNLRTPRITASGDIAAGEVKLKRPREATSGARNWDERLTLEFTGQTPSVRRIDIVPVKSSTLFLLGDSTVCDQSREPFASWGQMLPRFFKPGLAVANHGQSGETYRESLSRRRLDKILSTMQLGDTVVMQYGHNDQKQIRDGKGGPFTTYQAEIRTHVERIRARGGVPVLVAPMERRRFDESGKAIPTLTEYAKATRQVAEQLGVAFVDLNSVSMRFYQALGPEHSKVAFAEPKPGHIDNTHHNNYGAYMLARAVVTGLRQAGVPVAAFIADDAGSFDPTSPDLFTSFALPPSPGFTSERPLGD